ncbi:MAG: peptide chain release factor N(5)-glutamine methyltransferase [Thermodesulfobacteriota bacterium]|nr:peptide chain release factor N(5)-glutamine methyltransferase [Thermodesulfobacteriota bacterium]
MKQKPWNIRDLLKVTADYLRKKQIESPRLDAEVLLAYQLNVDRVTLYLNYDQPLTEKEISGYRALIRRRLRREPVQYITGVQEFWSLDFIVNPQVLIPRPESELLLDLAIKGINALARLEHRPAKILDLGTGCGALAISLATEVPQTQIWATDISPSALKLARLNAKKHRVIDRIEFIQGSLWEPLVNQDIAFDIILSNPPYIASEEYDDLPPEVRDYEPRLALDGKREGMYYIERIIRGAPDFAGAGALIILEMAPDQTEKALRIIGLTKGYADSSRIKDYSQCYRVVMAQNTRPIPRSIH